MADDGMQTGTGQGPDSMEGAEPSVAACREVLIETAAECENGVPSAEAIAVEPFEPADEIPGSGGQDGDQPDARVLQGIAAAEQRLSDLFERKLAFDRFKEQQIENLHRELQEYKRGLTESILLPLVRQIIRYVDQLPRHIAAMRGKSAEEVGVERLYRELENVVEDLHLMLENVGVIVYRLPESRFDALEQQPRMTRDTDDPARHHEIAERLLPGYKLNGRLVEKERVNVFVYRNPGSSSP